MTLIDRIAARIPSLSLTAAGKRALAEEIVAEIEAAGYQIIPAGRYMLVQPEGCGGSVSGVMAEAEQFSKDVAKLIDDLAAPENAAGEG